MSRGLYYDMLPTLPDVFCSGLGHLAIQYARALGHYVVAISSSATKRDIALELGAHLYLDESQVDVSKELQKLGGAKAIVSTVPDAQKTIDMLPGLGYEGKLLTLGLPGMQQATFYPCKFDDLPPCSAIS